MTFRTYLASPWADVDGRRSSRGDSVAVLDGIRGLAVLIVLASHTGAFGMTGQGSVGVFLFFALSGFVLMLPFAERPARIFQLREVWYYVANRALRIVPLYVAAVLFLRWYMSEPWPWAWLNLSFYAGWNHLWSVAEEVRFYLLFPFVVGLLALLPSRAWRIAALMAMMVFAWALRNQHRVDLLIDGTTFEFYFYFFLAGMLACLMYRAMNWHSVGLAYITDAIALTAALALAYLIGWQHRELWCGLFILLLTGITSSESSLASRLFRSWLMRHIGLLSYSLYLFHFSVSTWLSTFGFGASELFAVTFAVTYIIAIASYLAIEKPFLMLKPSRRAAAGLSRPPIKSVRTALRSRASR
jgi:peptidoglycan/LPS O-acetylase OafA/YrhL